MKLRPFFCFYGGKWRSAPRYPAPQHETIVEPFAGAAGYSTRYPDRRVILVEKDPVIAALWRFLIRVSADEVRRISLLGPDQTVDDLNVCEEARSLVGFWLNRAVKYPGRKPCAWMRDEKWARYFWGESVRERIASQVEHIRHWRVIEGSYESAPDVAATWFVDPPYQQAGRGYRCSSRDIDFANLGTWCRSLRGQVLVCEALGADWLPFQAFGAIRSLRGYAGEALWRNRDACEETP